jgi:long-subunit acyl-CoA synthetase (AMP-forming)
MALIFSQRYSSAFAFGLLEAGFKRGDSIVMWIDRETNAESIIAQLGAMKTGVTLVNFSENSCKDALDHALKSSNAKGLIFSPNTEIDQSTKRADVLHELMPELNSMYFGEELVSNAYPHLNHIVQTGFSTIKGTNKFKDVAVYTSPAMSTYEMPENSPDDVCIVTQKEGKTVSSYTNQELVNSANSSSANPSEVTFASMCMRTPLGFSKLLSATLH